MTSRNRTSRPSPGFRWALAGCLGIWACAIDDRRLGVGAPSSPSSSAKPADVSGVDSLPPGAGSPAASESSGDSAEARASGAAGSNGVSGEGGASSDRGAAGAAGARLTPAQCSGALWPCGELCVDLAVDHEHCSDCDRACGGNESCTDYNCVCSGELFPCLDFVNSVPATDYGILNLAGYRDATHDWVAYSDSTGNAGSTIVVRDNATFLSVRSIPVPHWDVQLVFLPNEPTLVYSSNGTLSHVTEQGQPTQLLTGVTWFQLSPDGQRLATLNSDNAMVLTLRSYPDLAVQEELAVSIPIGDQYERLAFSRDGRWLAATGLYENVQIQLFDLSNGSTRVMSAVGATGTYSPAFSEDGRELFVGGGAADGRVYVFDTATGAELRRLTPFDDYVYSIAQVQGFRQLLVGGFEGRIAIIDAVSGDQLWGEQIGLINRAIFSPDGSRLYIGSNPMLYMYTVH